MHGIAVKIIFCLKMAKMYAQKCMTAKIRPKKIQTDVKAPPSKWLGGCVHLHVKWPYS